jgi:cell division protein FtsX
MSNIHQVEVVVHVDDALNECQRSDLVRQLRGRDGVEDARFTSGRDHLMLIDYDRDTLKAQDVLDYVRESHPGAELVGPM